MAFQLESRSDSDGWLGSSTEWLVPVPHQFNGLVLKALTVNVMPVATEMAGVNMKLAAGAVRSVIYSFAMTRWANHHLESCIGIRTPSGPMCSRATLRSALWIRTERIWSPLLVPVISGTSPQAFPTPFKQQIKIPKAPNSCL